MAWVGKIRNFQPISHRISETVQDKTKVTINNYRKSHKPFRLVPKSTTLDDLEWPIRSLLMKRYFGAHHKNLNEDRTILSAAKM